MGNVIDASGWRSRPLAVSEHEVIAINVSM